MYQQLYMNHMIQFIEMTSCFEFNRCLISSMLTIRLFMEQQFVMKSVIKFIEKTLYLELNRYLNSSIFTFMRSLNNSIV